MKIRILNGGHQVIAGPGDLLGFDSIANAMAHPLIRGLLRKVMEDEVVPHVAPTPDMTPKAYLDLIDGRFSNPDIVDTTRRVAFDGSSRHPGFIVPSILDGLRQGTPTDGLALVSALWCRYCEGVREDGSKIEANDPHWAELQEAARISRTESSAWLGMRRIYGDLVRHEGFASDFARWRDLISREGVEAALRAYLSA